MPVGRVNLLLPSTHNNIPLNLNLLGYCVSSLTKEKGNMLMERFGLYSILTYDNT